MAKDTKQTGVGYITLTGIARMKGGKTRTTHTARLGFAGSIVKKDFRKFEQHMKETFEEQLRKEYPKDKYLLTMRSRLTFTECDMLLNGTNDGTGSN